MALYFQMSKIILKLLNLTVIHFSLFNILKRLLEPYNFYLYRFVYPLFNLQPHSNVTLFRSNYLFYV